MLHRRQTWKHLTAIDETAVMPWEKNALRAPPVQRFRPTAAQRPEYVPKLCTFFQQIEIEIDELFSFLPIWPNTPAPPC